MYKTLFLNMFLMAVLRFDHVYSDVETCYGIPMQPPPGIGGPPGGLAGGPFGPGDLGGMTYTKGEPENCAPGTKECHTTFQSMTAGGQTFCTMFKGCAKDRDQCKIFQEGQKNLPAEAKKQMSAVCGSAYCDKDNCNDQEPKDTKECEALAKKNHSIKNDRNLLTLFICFTITKIFQTFF